MMKKLLSLIAVAAVTIGVAAYAIGYEKFKINDASDYVSEYVLEFDANTNKPTNLDSTYKNGTYKAYTKDHNEITIKYENASANPNGYINLGQGGSILNPYIEGGYGNNRISSILNLTANFTGKLTLSLSAVNSTTYSIKNQSLTSGELYSVTNDDQYSYFKLDASTNCSITSIEIRYSCVYVDTAAFKFVKVDNGYKLTHYNGDGGDVVIPDTYLGLPVISIGSYAFSSCSSLTSIIIPDSVTTIGDYAFCDCDNLTTVTFGENSQLTSIGGYAFSGCSSLTSIIIPNSVTSIGSYAFSGCSNLTIYCEAASKPSGWSSSWNPSNLPVVWDCSNAVTTEDEFVYHVYENEDGSKYIVIDAYIGSSTEIIIPNTINVDGEEIKVTTIGERVFYDDDTITSVTIGDNVTTIGDYAFYSCGSLTSIAIPDSVTSIGNYAFCGCNNLTTVTFGENSQLTTIGDYAFSGCSSLTSITIPDSVTSIGSRAFYNCSSLTIYCEAATKPSGWSSSWNPSNRPVVWVGGDIIVDGYYAYVVRADSEERYVEIVRYLGSGGEVVIPDTINVDGEGIPVTTIADNVFSNNDTITSVTIGNNVTSIGSSAFNRCSSLTSIIIPDSVTSIGSRAFYNCSSLISIIIPDSVTTIGSNAFYNCSSLTIYCEAASEPDGWSSSWNSSNRPVIWDCSNAVTTEDEFVYHVYENEDGSKYIVIDAYIGSSTEIIIPNTINVNGEEIPVTSFDELAFYENKIITSIKIGNNVTSIGERAFYWCSNLTTVTIGENSQLTSIGSRAFYGCSSLTSIIIPNSVTKIGSYAFYGCNSLAKIYIPKSVTKIGSYAFSYCDSSLTIYCEATSKPSGWDSDWNENGGWARWNCTVTDNGLIYEESYDMYSVADYLGSDTRVSISSSINELPVKSIRYNAFKDCSFLTSIYIPESITSISDDTFANCSNITIYCEVSSKPDGWGSGWNSTNRPVIWGSSSIGFETDNTQDGFEYAVFEDEDRHKYVSIIGYEGSSTEVVIPKNIVVNGESIIVGAIGGQAFYNNDTIISITIPDTVITISGHAFYDCDNLTTVTIGENSQLTSIGDYAFSGCSSLTTVTFGENSQLTTIGSNAFTYCSSLTSITIPDSVTTIGVSAFENCSNLTTVTIGENSQLTSIGDYAFYDCWSLTSITIPDSVTTIGYYAFRGCSNLTIYCEAASEPSGWNSNWNYSNRPVVWDCLNAKTTEDGLVYYIYENEDRTKYIVIGAYIGTATDVVIPDTINVDGVDIPVTTIGERAFSGCSSLTSITIPDSVTTIGDSAFSDCSNLVSIIIPDSVTTIDSYAFSGCFNLTIYCEAASKPDGWAYNWNSSNRPVVWGYTGVSGEYNGLEYAVSIDNEGNKYITITGYNGIDTNVVIPDTINVDGVDIPVTTIGDYAFRGCSSLTSITIPDSVTSIGFRAFSGCSSLTSITIPDSVTTIGDYAFSGCSSLTSITIPDSVTIIGDYAFSGCDSLTSIIIPNSVISIGSYAFLYCSNITIYCEATSQPSGWNSSWNSFGRPVVWDYTGVNGEHISGEYNGLEYVVCIDSEGNKYITITGYNGTDTNVVIPDTIVVDGEEIKVTTIADNAFYNNDIVVSVTIGNNVTTIGGYAFQYCSSLASITIPDSVTTIGERAFTDCYSLTSIIIPDSVTTIGDYAFSGCSSLTSIIIPDSVTTIGYYAFENCSNLTIYCEATSKPSGWSSSWNDFARPVVWVGGDIFVDGNYAYVVRTSGEERYVEIVTYLGSGGEVVILDTININGEEIKVTTIGERAFYDNDTITSVTIGNNVTTIGERAFYGCSSLTSIIIPSSVITIGSYAFENCSSLTIYCEATSKPSGWDSNWNPSNRPVEWDYTGE